MLEEENQELVNSRSQLQSEHQDALTLQARVSELEEEKSAIKNELGIERSRREELEDRRDEFEVQLGVSMKVNNLRKIISGLLPSYNHFDTEGRIYGDVKMLK